MGKAEVGTPKWIDNRSKAKGLTKLNFYCPVCQKANRDENGFKMHTMSESHVRKVELMGDDAKVWIEDTSNEFKTDFLRLLRTAHGDKQVHINHFYQEFIADRHHVHMVGTKWSSLTEFAKYLGREGICRVEETEKGVHVAWIDNSPDALRRRDALRLREQQEHGDGEIERRLIREQIRRARATAQARDADDGRIDQDARELTRKEGDKISLAFTPKARSDCLNQPSVPAPELSVGTQFDHTPLGAPSEPLVQILPKDEQENKESTSKPAGFGGLSFKKAGKPQTRNVFESADDDEEEDTTGKMPGGRKLTEADRIMKEEQQRKRGRDSRAFGFNVPPGKRLRPH